MSSAEGAPRVLLLGDDLLLRSRVQQALPGALLVSGGQAEGRFDLVLVDLNRGSEERLRSLAERLLTTGQAEVICVGPHTELAQMKPTVQAAGARRLVANSHLQRALVSWRAAWERQRGTG